MFKTNDQRFNDALAVIRQFGNEAETLTRRYIDAYPNRQALGQALHLDARPDGTAAETERRNHLRAAILLTIAVGGQTPSQAAFLQQRWAQAPKLQLRAEVESRLPLFDPSPLRHLWNPMNFTQAKDPLPAQFRYFVFGMMNEFTGRGVSYDSLISNPDQLKSFMLSTSLIDEDHRATYYPYGFILTVPEHNVVSTRSEDQAFKNRKADDGTMAQAVLMDSKAEVRRVAAEYPLAPPDQILAKVVRAGGRIRGQDGDSGYNEIVVLGTAPGGSEVRVSGIFMKVDSRGNRYQRKGDKKGAYVTDAIHTKLLALSSGRGIPIVKLADPSGENG